MTIFDIVVLLSFCSGQKIVVSGRSAIYPKNVMAGTSANVQTVGRTWATYEGKGGRSGRTYLTAYPGAHQTIPGRSIHSHMGPIS